MMASIRILLVGFTDELVGDVIRRSIEGREGMAVVAHVPEAALDHAVREHAPDAAVVGLAEAAPAPPAAPGVPVLAVVRKHQSGASIHLASCVLGGLLELVESSVAIVRESASKGELR